MLVNISNELLVDVVKFLDRNQIEKCQLVNGWWNNLVKFNEPYLPIRLLEKLLGYDEKEDVVEYVNHSENIELISESIRHIINTTLFNVFFIQAYTLPKVLSTLEKFHKKYGIKFNVKIFAYNQGDYESAKLDLLITSLPNLFENFLSAFELTLIHSSKGYKRMIECPKVWQRRHAVQKKLNMIINLVDDDKIFNSKNKINVRDIVTFIREREAKYECYTFSLKNVEEEFLEKYFGEFEERSSVLMIKEIHWRTRNERDLQLAKKFFVEQDFAHRKLLINGLPADDYQKIFNDGWSFRCELIWELVWPHIRLSILQMQ